MACNYRSYEDAIIKMEITDDTNERRGQNEKNSNIGQTRDEMITNLIQNKIF